MREKSQTALLQKDTNLSLHVSPQLVSIEHPAVSRHLRTPVFCFVTYALLSSNVSTPPFKRKRTHTPILFQVIVAEDACMRQKLNNY